MKKVIFFFFCSLLVLQVHAQVSFDSLIQLRNSVPLEALIAADKLLYAPATPDSLIPYLNREKGYALQTLKDLPKSIEFLEKSRDGFLQSGSWEQVFHIEIQLSSNYAQLDQQVEALQFATSTLQIAEKLQKTEWIIKSNENFSYVYYLLGELDEAISYMEKSETYHQQQHNTKELSITYNNLAILHRNKGNYSRSLEYDQKAMQLNRQLNDQIALSNSFNNQGNTYLLLSQNKKAVDFFEKAIAINDSLGINNSNPIRSLASINNQQGDYLAELALLKKALKLEKNTGRLDYQKTIYQSLLKNQLILGQTTDAATYQTEIERIDKELSARQNDEKLQLVETSRQILENELKWQQEKQRTQSYQWIALSSLLLSLALGIYYFQKQKQKDLYTQKKRAQLENQVLRSQMNPHFIFNALTSIQHTVMENNPLNAALSISRFAKLIRQYFDFVQKEYISLEEELDALSNYVTTQQMRFGNSFDYDCQKDLILRPDQIHLPPLLIQPLIENAIEHGFKGLDSKGHIDVKITQPTQELLTIVVEDNGKGYQPKEDGHWHALDILKARLKFNQPKNKKTFRIEALKPTGTRVELTIALKSE